MNGKSRIVFAETEQAARDNCAWATTVIPLGVHPELGKSPQWYCFSEAEDAAEWLSARESTTQPIEHLELVGSDKQVAWATQIRAAAHDWLNGFGAKPNQMLLRAEIAAALRNESNAGWWIDNRDKIQSNY